MTNIAINPTALAEEIDDLEQRRLLHDPSSDLYWALIRKIEAKQEILDNLRRA